jgi:hypothetical protein
MKGHVRIFKDGDNWFQTSGNVPPHVLSDITKYMVTNHQCRLTGVTRWFMDARPCRVLSFVTDPGNTFNVYVQFTA